MALIRGDGIDRRLVLRRNRQVVDLATLAPGATLAVAIAAERALEIENNGRTLHLGVQVLPAPRSDDS